MKTERGSKATMEGEEVKLLGAWPSLFSYRIIWALKLKGVHYEYIEEDVAHKSKALLQYNPVSKKIPVLVNGGRSLMESTVILEYIEETWSHTHSLLPQDPFDRSTARFWIKFAEDKHPDFFNYFQKTGEEQQRSIAEAKQVLTTIEEHYNTIITNQNKNIFFGGDRIGMVDLVFGWMAWWLDAMEEAVGVKLMEEDEFPLLQKWKQCFIEAAVIRDNLPDRTQLVLYFKRLRNNFVASV